MAEIGGSGGVPFDMFQSLSDGYNAFVSAVDGRINAILDKISASAFVSTTPMTTASLLATYPASATNVGKYARVTDLYGSVDEVMRCRYDGVNYRWVPQRDSFNGSSANASGSVTVVPLVTPPVLDLTGTLTGNLSVNLTTDNAYIGQTQTIRARGVLGLFAINVSGLLGGGTLPLLTGSDKMLVYTAAGWRG